ncbi:DEAD/DEAH box helicase [Spirochaetota bacterium]
MKELKEYIAKRFNNEVRAHLQLDKRAGSFTDFPVNLQMELTEVLQKEGIERLYDHQAEAFESISNNENTLLVSHTASGKTLSFFLPIFNEYIQAQTPFSVLFLYPTKALSRDQENTFGMLIAETKRSFIGTYDGDTPRDEREKIQKGADFIITNPDMLHNAILPNHNRRWKGFLSRLRYIVVDEVHIYRGSFGSHVSNVFKRLLRVCQIHGSNPVFVCSSATVGNPNEHVQALFNGKFNIIDNDSAPKPHRDIYFINPPLVQSHGISLYRKGTSSVSIPLIREAAARGIRTICFCRARQEVERLYRAVVDGSPHLKGVVKPYRGGLLPNERRQLERDLSNGKITVIITTNALELGIDIGDLELCILSGHPGTIASFWQQAGRVGRKGNSSVIVFIPKERPIDQYLVNHPEFITEAPVEEALVNANNPYILLQHLPCAAQEHPLKEEEDRFEEPIYSEALNILKEDGTLVPYKDALRFALQDYPARGVNLRGMTDYNVEIVCGTEIIGELDPIGARGTLYKDAIYQHLGRKYMSMNLDLDKKLCMVEPVDVDYYTEAVWEKRLDMVDRERGKEIREGKLDFGIININKQPKLYKKIRERSYENIGYGPITLPPFEYDSTGFSLTAPEKWSEAMATIDKRYIEAAFFGLSYLLKHTAPIFCMADMKDVETDVSLIERGPRKWVSALYMYDVIEGGVGYSEKIHDKIESCFEFCYKIIKGCTCKTGCPICVPPLPPGVNNEELETFLMESNAAVACAESLVQVFMGNGVIIPEVEINKINIHHVVSAPPEDEERKRMNQKLNRAAVILKKRRERLH